MDERSEPTFSVSGQAEIFRRLAQIARRQESLARDFDANQREYDELRAAWLVLEAEERDLRRQLG
jgi:cell division protein FtsB